MTILGFSAVQAALIGVGYILMLIAIVRVVRFGAGDHPHRDHLRAVSGAE